MPKGMQAIYQQVVGAGGITFINLQNIPQTYDDLYMTISARSNGSNSGQQDIGFYINGFTYPAPVNWTRLSGYATSTLTGRNSGFGTAGNISDASQTANIFSVNSIYIPNYRSTHAKQAIIESVTEHNGTTNNFLTLGANLQKQNSPVTAINVDIGGNTFLQYSTFTLYGISR